MMKRFLSKTLVFLLAFLMVFSAFGTAAFATGVAVLTAENAENAEEKQEDSMLKEIEELLNSSDYAEYRELYKDAPNGTDDQVILGADYNVEKTDAKVVVDDWCGYDQALIIPEVGNVVWDFEVKNTGNYHIAITYAPI
ncbi:MAG: hypothetical protein IKD18_03540, partial [Clostridia bacterium]|nr:hypothetical protein [Clostridia bacterium]